MNSTEDDWNDSDAVFELSGEKFDPQAFVGLIDLKGGSATRRGDRKGRDRTAVCGVQLFSIENSDGLSLSEVIERLLNGLRRNLTTIKQLADDQELDWGILIFEGNLAERGLAGVGQALLDDAAALGIPIRQKFGL